MMNTSDAVWLSAITAFSAVAVAFTNMVGSVLILWIRAKYQYHETSSQLGPLDDVRDIPNPGAKPATGAGS